MIKLYEPSETSFKDNGIGTVKNIYSAIITEQDNGDYYLELEANTDQFEELKRGRIIVCDLDDGSKEGFRIGNVTKKGKRVKIKAMHLYYDSQQYMLAKEVEINNLNGPNAMQWIAEHTDDPHPFLVSSDIETTYQAKYTNFSMYEAFDDLLTNMGGHLERSMFSVSLKKEIGADRQVVIAVGKNVTDDEIEYKWEDVCTKLLPLGNEVDGVQITLPERYLYSDIQYEERHTKKVQFDTSYEKIDQEKELSDQEKEELQARRDAEDAAIEARREGERQAREEEKEQKEFMMTEWEKEEYEAWFEQNEDRIKEKEDAEDEARKTGRDAEDKSIDLYKQLTVLREMGKQYMKEHETPTVTYSYKTTNIPCHLGDTVEIRDSRINLDIMANVTEIKYDVIMQKPKEITFGNYSNTLKNAIESVTTKTVEKRITPKMSKLQMALQQSKDTIQKYLFGCHVYQTENATYYLNAETPEEADKFLIVTLGGIGFGTKNKGEPIAGNETYETAWDIDGHFNANFITAGTLEGLLFKGGQIELETENGVNKILQNPADGIRINRMDPDTKLEESIMYLNNKGYLVLRGDGAGLDITSNDSIKGLESKIIQLPKEVKINVDDYIYGSARVGTGKVGECVIGECYDAKISAQFKETADQISLTVKKGDLISTINQSVEKISMKAVDIDLSGCVTFSNLSGDGETVINAGNITTGILSAVGINIGNGAFTVDADSGFVTAKSGHYGGWAIGDYVITSIPDVVAEDPMAYLARRNGIQAYGNGSYAISIGYSSNSRSWSDGYFTVTHSGDVKCNSLVCGGSSFNGHSHATGSTIDASLYGTSNGRGDYIYFSNGGQGATTGWCAATFQYKSSSDMRLKYDIQTPSGILNMYQGLKPKQYRFKDTKENDKVHYGLLAQQVINLLSENGIDYQDTNLIEIVENAPGRDDGMYCSGGTHYRINYEELHAWHILAIQELVDRISELEEKVI